jgi:4-amino-4-deoxy-L-arabinose transferase-like glycosyltransferase
MPPSTINYQKKLWWLIGISVFAKILLSFFLELGNDEVYYYTYALQPDWNHFDHPPMVGWLIRIFTFNLYWLSDLSMRLGSIVCAALTTIIIFESGTLLKNEKAGWIAALLYTLSIYTSIIAGLFVMPDSPQLLFFTLSIYVMLNWVMKPHVFTLFGWVLLGLFIGLATLSKVHGLYLWVGFGLYIIFNQVENLKEKNGYLAILVTLLCIIPILYWNFQNDFITYRFHSKRVMHTGISFSNFITQIGGEFFYQNPLVYIAVLISLLRVSKVKFQAKSAKAINLLLWLSLPLLFIFWAVSLFNATLPHWTGPAFIPLFLIAGVYWASYSRKFIPVLLKFAIGFMILLVIGFVGIVKFYPKQLGSEKLENLGEYNPINDVTGWAHFSEVFKGIAAKDQIEGRMSKQAPIVVHKWFPGGHLLFYTAPKVNARVIAIGALEDVHKFAWLNENQEGMKIGEDAYSIVPSNLPANPIELYGAYFTSIEKPDTIPYMNKGVLLRNFYVYRLKGCKLIPVSILKPKKEEGSINKLKE